MMKQILNRSDMALFSLMLFIFSAVSLAQAGNLLDDMQVQDTCGTTYADKLASCTPFKCQKPNSIARMFGFPSEKKLAKMSPEQQQKMRALMEMEEKKLEAMSPQERAVMKARMIWKLEIKGYTQGLCQTKSILLPENRQDCAYDAPMLKRVSDFEKAIAKADHVKSKRSGQMVHGKWVSKEITEVDGKVIDNPRMDLLNSKICKTLYKDSDQGWMDSDQMIRLSHVKFNLSEHGKHVDGHIQILNAVDGKVLFDKDVETSKNRREINLKPGTFDIKVTSKNPQLAPVWFRGIKRGEAKVFKKDVEFYAISGTLKLSVKLNGKPSKSAAVYMTDPKTGKWIYHSGFDDEHKPVFHYMPVSIKLPETLTGKYEVHVTPVIQGFKPPKDAKYQKFLLTIKNGETIEKKISF